MAREAKDIQNILLPDLISAKSDELIQHGLRIAHPSIRADGNGVCGQRVECHAFLFRDVEQVPGDERRRDFPQIEALAAAEDGGEYLCVPPWWRR